MLASTIADSFERFSHQAMGMIGPVPMCTTFLVNSFFLGNIFFEMNAIKKTIINHKKIGKKELRFDKSYAAR